MENPLELAALIASAGFTIIGVIASIGVLIKAFSGYVTSDADKTKANTESIAQLNNQIQKLSDKNERLEKSVDSLRVENKDLDHQFYTLKGASDQVISDLIKARDSFTNQTAILVLRDQEIADLKKVNAGLQDTISKYEKKITSLEERVAVLEGQKPKAAIIAQEGIDHPPAEAQEASEAK